MNATPTLPEAAAERAPSAARRECVRRSLLLLSVAADILAVFGGYFIAAYVRFRVEVGGAAELPDYWPVMLATIGLWPAFFAMAGMYDQRRLTAGWQEMRRVFSGVSNSVFAVIILSFLVAQRDLSRAWTLAVWPTCFLTVIVTRTIVRKSVHILRTRGRLRTRVVIVGTNEEARSIARTLGRNRWIGFEPVGFVCPDVHELSGNGHANGSGNGHLKGNGHPAGRRLIAINGGHANGNGNGHDGEGGGRRHEDVVDGLPVIESSGGIATAARVANAGTVLVASSAMPQEGLATVYRDLQEADIDVRISAGVLNIAASRLAVEPLDGMPVLALRRMQLPRSQAIAKRIFDVAGGLALIVFFAPLLIACAAAVKFTSPGPVFYRQRRIGANGAPFTMLKFRSMVVDADKRVQEIKAINEADGGILFKSKDDPRVTRAGKFLRKWSLDELPQFFNVLVGTMSLVGPRPPLPCEVAEYDAWLKGRLKVKPGVTGLWQVNGRHELSFEDYVRYDLFYVRNWSVALDLSILWRTVPAVLSRRGSW